MTVLEASESEAHIIYELIKLSRFDNMFQRLEFGDKSVIVVTKLLVQYSENLDSSHKVSFQMDRVFDTARDLVKCGSIQGAI